MFGEVLAASISVGSLTIAVWCWFQGLVTHREDELHSLIFFMGLLLLPLAVLFGMMAGAEAWVFVGVIWFASVFIFSVRSLLRLEENK